MAKSILEDLKGSNAVKMPSKKTSPDATVTIGGKKVKVKDLKGSMKFFETDKDPKIELDGKRYDLKPVEMPKFAEGGKFPDLTGDGEVTQADVLKGRGVFAEGSEVYPEEPKLDEKNKYVFDEAKKLIEAGKVTDLSMAMRITKRQADKKFGSDRDLMSPERRGEMDKNMKRHLEMMKMLEERDKKAEGSLMMPAEGMPVDTYPNIPADEMDEVMASQLPDEQMEDDYISYVMDESLNDSEQNYLAGVLQQDDRLSDILDKVITTASEFSGAGEVDGPGTGVSDSIPARLSDGEFVFTKKATDQIGADNLQVMMDDAERAYDGGLQAMAEGGMMDEEDPGMSKTKEEIEKLMMGANRMPSLR